MKRTLVRFTLMAIYDGPQTEAHLAEVGDQLADLVRLAEDDVVSVSSQYDSVEADLPEDDELGALHDALFQAKQKRRARRASK
jgi:hypothetical protein